MASSGSETQKKRAQEMPWVLFLLSHSFHTFISISFPLLIPCCLLFWDGVKLELELELELAGLGCSDLKEKKKKINNILRDILLPRKTLMVSYCLKHSVKKKKLWGQIVLKDLNVKCQWGKHCGNYYCTHHTHTLLV